MPTKTHPKSAKNSQRYTRTSRPKKSSRADLAKTLSKSQISPKIALVCDWLTTPGGAEKVLLQLHLMYPDAPIYTSQYSRRGIDWFNDATVKTGWLQFFPKGLRKFLGPLRQLYFSHLDLSDYDIVISVTGAEAKAIHTQGYHLCYCHVPTQYYWQMYDRYLANPGFGFLNPLVRLALKLLVKPLRQADFNSAQKPNQFVTISTYAAKQIQRYYHRDSIVVAPPVDITKFCPNSTSQSQKTSSQYSLQKPQKTAPRSESCEDLTTFPPSHPNFSTENTENSTIFPPVNSKLSTKNANISTKIQQKSTKTSKKSTDYSQLIHQNQGIIHNFSTATKRIFHRITILFHQISTLFHLESTGKSELSTNYPQNTANNSPLIHKNSATYPPKSGNYPQLFHSHPESFPQANNTFPPNIKTFPPEIHNTDQGFPQDCSAFSPYYIIACRQVNWKRVDLAILACQKAKLPLLVVGDGAEHARLVKLAANSQYVSFLPWASQAELAYYLQHAKGYIFPSLEPFGIAAVEALAAGCPVIAYKQGGSQDFIRDGKNGLLFPKQTVTSLTQALQKFETLHFDRRAVSRSAEPFSATHFEEGIKQIIKGVKL